MPTPLKRKQIDEVKERLSRCTIAIATGYQGLTAPEMTGLRKHLRGQGVEYRVVKNTLVLLAAQELEHEGIGSVMAGPTAVAFGYGDVVDAARSITTYITSTRSPLVVHGAFLNGSVLTAEQVRGLALLPPREELLARLIGQIQSPLSGLVNVLSAPIRNLAYVLQRIAEQGGATASREVPQ